MKSPIYPRLELVKVQLEKELQALHCPKSEGHWINADEYRRWCQSHNDDDIDSIGSLLYHEVAPEDQMAKICPESGALLSRYRVSESIEFYLDRSPITGGVWFDRGEWETIKQLGLQFRLAEVFTDSWQRAIVDNEQRESLMMQFKKRIGSEAFYKVNEFKYWLKDQVRRSEILAYLANDE